MCLYPGYPELNLQLSHKNDFIYAPDWYHNIEYTEDQEEGYEYREDLFVPGTFEVSIKKGESIFFSAGTTPLPPLRMKYLFKEEAANRTPRSSFTNCLKNSAYQFYNKHADGQRYILAGYPWFKCRARDLFISLPGCTIAAKDTGLFEAIMKTGGKAIRNYIENKPLDCDITEMDAPDVLLWFIWSIQEYAKSYGIETCCSKYGVLIFDVLGFILNQQHQNLSLHNNGLLYTNGEEIPVSWMNSTFNGKPLVPRTGYLIEFNALWYNALCFGAKLATFAKKDYLIDLYTKQAQITAQSFVAVFYNQYGYLFDFVNGGQQDWSVRPNQIFAVSLKYSPLTNVQQKTVLDLVTKELLTPKGLRTLSPKSTGYSPIYEGNEEQRARAYHQGTAWPWLIGPYLEAYLKIYKNSGVNFAQRIIYGFEEELNERAIGTISEFFDGNPPYCGRGGVSFAMSVAEILRIRRSLKNMDNNTQDR